MVTSISANIDIAKTPDKARKMKRQIISGFAFAILLSPFLNAQEIWTVEQCIQYALEQSLTIERAQVNEEFAEVALKQSQQARWPSLNVNTQGGLNFGRVINPSTNQFETDDSYYHGLSIGSGMMLFGGNQINNGIKQANIDLEAAQEDLKQARVNLALDVALAYLNVLFAQENVTNAETTLALSESQLEQIDKLIAAGSRPQNERYDIVAQIALDQKNLVQFENEVEQNMLILKQLMRLDPGFDLQVVTPEFEEELLQRLDNYTFESVYTSALETQPQIKAQELRIESAKYGEKLARSTTLPTFSMGANAGTNWSDLDQQVTSYETIFQPIEGLYLNGMPLPIEQELEVPKSFETTPYFDQWNDNFGFGVSFNLRVPIYNNYQNKANIDRAKLNTILELNSEEQIRQNLKIDIQNALATARAARKSLEASQLAHEAAEVAYSNSQKRFDLGTLNSYDFINARNRLTSAQINLTISKYDYIFRLLIIEYYLGRGVRYE